MMRRRMVEVQRLCREYQAACAKQQRSVDQLLEARRAAAGGIVGYVHIGEHSPVYTLGKHAKVGNVLVSTAQLDGPLVRIDRGGDVTYHGPGQVVMYPIFDLHRLNLGAREFVSTLLDSVAETVNDYGIAATSLPDAAGLWLLPTATAPLRKICAVGVHISRGISTHGIALNVNTDLSAFTKINPCGFADRGVTSMTHELGGSIPFGGVVQNLLRHVGERFGVEFEESDEILNTDAT